MAFTASTGMHQMLPARGAAYYQAGACVSIQGRCPRPSTARHLDVSARRQPTFDQRRCAVPAHAGRRGHGPQSLKRARGSLCEIAGPSSSPRSALRVRRRPSGDQCRFTFPPLAYAGNHGSWPFQRDLRPYGDPRRSSSR